MGRHLPNFMYIYCFSHELKQSKKYQKFPSQPGDSTCNFYLEFFSGIITNQEKELPRQPGDGTWKLSQYTQPVRQIAATRHCHKSLCVY